MGQRFTILAILILVIFAALNISGMRYNSPVCDEVSHHIATGYSFLKTRDFRLNSTQPPLIEELSAIPLLFLKPKLPLEHPSWSNIDRSTFGFQFLFRYSNDANRIIFWARIPIVLISVLCGFLVFLWASQLYGEKAGLFSLFLYVFSPNIIAYSQIVTADIGGTFFILLAMYRFCKFIKKPKAKNVVLAGITLGLAEASKLTALILIPFFAVVVIWKWLVARRNRHIIGLIAIFVLCYLVVFLSYFGEIKPLLKNDVDVPEKIGYIERLSARLFPGKEAIKDTLVDFALNKPMPFTTYIMNILSSTNMVFGQHIFKAFLSGRYSETGWWYYYIVAFLLKTPIPFLTLIFIWFIFFRRVRSKDKFAEKFMLGFIAVFSIISLFSKLQLSIRYILPVYPFMFILVSKIANITSLRALKGRSNLSKKDISLTVAILILCIWYLAESLLICPNYLAYFNQLAGGADNGWRYLRDANIDYGQDLPALASYLKKNNIEKIKLSYFGTADPAYYGISYENITEEETKRPRQAVYAVSVNNIDGILWTNDIKPTAKAGYSIFIYDFRAENGS